MMYFSAGMSRRGIILKKVLLSKYAFSKDPLVERLYTNCVNNIEEDCQPVRGMAFQQLKELRNLESGSFNARMDWKNSDSYEQWSERITHLGITRIYTFKSGRLVDWVDFSIK